MPGTRPGMTERETMKAGSDPGLFLRHCEELRDEAIHISACLAMDCFASLAMTI